MVFTVKSNGGTITAVGLEELEGEAGAHGVARRRRHTGRALSCRSHPGVEAGAQLLILLIFFQFITDDITNMHLN
jgi:hypothetical protein